MATTVQIIDVSLRISAPSIKELPEGDLPELCIVGRSNVGKSSLINLLLSRKGLAHTSRTPGRTRLANLFEAELRRGAQRKRLGVMDLPGYGYAKIAAGERARIDRLLNDYLTQSRRPRCALLLLDARRTPGEQEKELAQGFREQGVSTVAVFTKVDQVVKSKRVALRKLATPLETNAFALTSATERLGRNELWSLLWPLLFADAQA